MSVGLPFSFSHQEFAGSGPLYEMSLIPNLCPKHSFLAWSAHCERWDLPWLFLPALPNMAFVAYMRLQLFMFFLKVFFKLILERAEERETLMSKNHHPRGTRWDVHWLGIKLETFRGMGHDAQPTVTPLAPERHWDYAECIFVIPTDQAGETWGKFQMASPLGEGSRYCYYLYFCILNPLLHICIAWKRKKKGVRGAKRLNKTLLDEESKGKNPFSFLDYILRTEVIEKYAFAFSCHVYGIFNRQKYLL